MKAVSQVIARCICADDRPSPLRRGEGERFFAYTNAMTPPISASVLDQLRRYDTPTICNVVELFDRRPRTAGYFDARIQTCYPKLPPMVGFASTATFRSAEPPRKGDVYAGLAEQVASFAKLPQPVVVVFPDLDDP